MKLLTAKQQKRADSKVIEYAKSLVGKFTPEQIARATWNKFGYITSVVGESVFVFTANGKVEVK